MDLPYKGIKKYFFVVVGRVGCGSRIEGLWVEGVVGRGSKVAVVGEGSRGSRGYKDNLRLGA